MATDDRFEMLKELYEAALRREDSRKNTFEQKATSLIGFTGAMVGLFVGTFTPKLLSQEVLHDILLKRHLAILWAGSAMCLLCGLLVFILLVWRWKVFLKPLTYMHHDPSSLVGETAIEEMRSEYLSDLERSKQHNLGRINELGSQFRQMTDFVMIIIVSFFISVAFFIICSLYIKYGSSV